MAKLEEIIKTEMSRSDSRTFSRIHLFREGSFLRAYEQSAWLMSRYAAGSQVRQPMLFTLSLFTVHSFTVPSKAVIMSFVIKVIKDFGRQRPFEAR